MIKFEIDLNDNVFNCYLSKKARKNINVSIKVNNEIYISKPKKVSKKQIKTYLKENKLWILKKSSDINKLHTLRNSYQTKSSIYLFGSKYIIKRTNVDEITLCDDILLVSEDVTIKEIELFLYNQLLEYVIHKTSYLNKIITSRNLNVPIIKIRNMRGKWGSCYTHKGLIYLNNKLIHYPHFCIDYVMLHEYVHLFVPNHSKQFYEIIEYYMPNYKVAINYLKTN